MLNYNLNINSPLQQAKKNEDVRPPIYWDFHSFTSASDNTDLNEGTYGFMSINAPNTNCIQVSVDSGNLFATDAQYPVTASITGSNWPSTGSVTMSLNTAALSYDPVTPNRFFSASFKASALDIYNNPNITGSKLINAFSASEFVRFYVSGSIIAMKGNVYNGPINWKVSSSSTTQDLEGNQSQLNNNSSSFNLKKDLAVLVSYSNITSSINGTYTNFYSFNQTASLTSSILPNTTGSVTMSLEIPEIGFSTSSRFFNTTSAGNKILSASWTASTTAAYNVTASVINNKGNQSNSNINWYISSSGVFSGTSSSLNIKKDANITMVSQSVNLSTSGTYKNDYAFNQTASLSSSFEPFYNSDSSSFIIQKLHLAIPELNVSSSLWMSSSCGAPYLKVITASFEAQTNLLNYNITASIVQYQQSVFNFWITASGGGAGGATGASGGGGGGGMVVSGSTTIQPNLLYTVTVARTGSINSDGEDTSFVGCNRTKNFYAGGGKLGLGGNGGNSGTGYITENGVTQSVYPAFTGGAFQYTLGGYPQNAAGGGASNRANGGIGDPTSPAYSGGNGANGDTAGGGGGYNGEGPTPQKPGIAGQLGTANPLLFGAGIGGNGQSTTATPRSATTGSAGIVLIRYAGSGSLFQTVASSSYNPSSNETTYFFTASATLIYSPQITLS